MLSRHLYPWALGDTVAMPKFLCPFVFLCLYFPTSIYLTCAVLVPFKIQTRGGSFEFLKDSG